MDIDKIIQLINAIIAAIGNCPQARDMSDEELVKSIETMSRLDAIRLWLALGRNGTIGKERQDCMALVRDESKNIDFNDAVQLVAEARREG